MKKEAPQIEVKTGMVLAVPLWDGSLALAHVAENGGNGRIALFVHRRATMDELFLGLEDALQRKAIAILTVPLGEIENGNWLHVADYEATYPVSLLTHAKRSYEAKAVPALFEAVYGMRVWDEPVVPGTYEDMLLPHLPVPPKMARTRAHFDRAAAEMAAAAAAAPPRPPLPEGGGVIHIEIKYPGEELPTIALLKRRQAIENGLETAGVGEITDAGGGGGIMDIYLETNDVAHALPFVHAAIKEAGFENDARIEIGPVVEDDEEDTTEPLA